MKNSEDILNEFLDNNSIPYKKDKNLRYETYFKQGGKADFFITPSSTEQLTSVISCLKKNSIEWKLVGLTSNVYFLSELQYGVIISTKNLTQLNFDGETFDVECGYPLIDLVRVTLTHGYGGNEGLEGIPGTIGGAVFMNAGAYGYTISDHIISVTILTPTGKIEKLSKAACRFKHRDSIFKDEPENIIVSAQFKYPKSDTHLSAEKIETFHIARHSYQEFAYPNIGSTFSATNDFYLELVRGSWKHTALCYISKLIFKNPITKIINRKKPTNSPLNRIALNYLKYDSDFIHSKKTLNTIINNGKADFITLADQVIVLKNHLKNDTPIENEFILSPLSAKTRPTKEILDRAHALGILSSSSIEPSPSKP